MFHMGNCLGLCAALALAFALTPARAYAAPIYGPGPGEGVTTDIFDVAQGTQVIVSTPQHNQCCGNSDPRSLIGFTGTWVEPTHSTFIDNPGAGTVESITFQTPNHINLSSFSLRLADDGSAARSASSFNLFASADGVNFSSISSGVIPHGGGGSYSSNPILIADSALGSGASYARAFRLELTRASTGGPRTIELDGTGASVTQTGIFVDRNLFNANTNVVDGSQNDEMPGLVNSITASSALGGDDPQGAFGNNNGPVEANTFLFADNGPGLDTLEWTTSSPVSLVGLRFLGGGAGPPGDPRRIGSLMLETDLNGDLVYDKVLFLDPDYADGVATNYLFGNMFTASRFRLTVQGIDSSGPRISEIDAITAPLTALPEPGSIAVWTLAGLGAVTFGWRSWRKGRRGSLPAA